MLQEYEYQALSSLADDLGYKLLMEKIQSELDSMQQSILDMNSPINSQKINLWKALNAIFSILKTTPNLFNEEFTKLKETTNFIQQNEENAPIPMDYFNILMKEYIKKTNLIK